jgi:uncharacterized protein
MFLHVRDMELRPLQFSLDYPVGQIDFLDGNLKQASVLSVSGQAAFNDLLSEIHLTGNLKVTMNSDCDRCLETTSIEVDSSFDLTYAPVDANVKPEIGLEERDIELAFYEGNGLELDDVLRERIILIVPMQRLCRPDCQGLCPVCGENRNLKKCSCLAGKKDDRWASLRAWQDQAKAGE